MFVLGVDPGVSRCGYGCVTGSGRGGRAVALGVLTTPPSDPLPHRLATLDRDLRELVAEMRASARSAGGQLVVAVERLFFQTNVRTAMSVGQASGLVLAAAAGAGCEVVQYTPNEVKQAVAGTGAAPKEQVQRMVQSLLGLAERPSPPDAADALALALCHLARAPCRRACGRSPPDDRVAAGPAGSPLAAGEAIVEVGGIGYRVSVSPPTLAALGDVGGEVVVHTHLHVREDALTLYGFAAQDERDCFEALLGAHGVGPALALAIVAVHPPSQLRRVLVEGDLDALTLVPGVGRKTAARLLMELKARLDVPEFEMAVPDGNGNGSSPPLAELRAALAGLGYEAEEVRRVSRDLPVDADLETLLRSALRLLAASR